MTGPAGGLDRIAAAFAGARKRGRAALMPYLMGAYPDRAGAPAVAEAYAAGGADLIELGIPFSDPLADGPVIHAAATEALTSGATMDAALASVATVADRVPVVTMAYANMVLARGPEDFAAALADAGLCGAIVPDLPPESAGDLASALAGRELALIPLLAPTTTPERRARVCAAATGFIYLVSVRGVTGERASMPPELAGLVADARAAARVPVAVGFGIGTPEQAAEVGEVADGVIIGSRLVREVAENGAAEGARRAGEFLAAASSRMSA